MSCRENKRINKLNRMHNEKFEVPAHLTDPHLLCVDAGAQSRLVLML